MGKMTSGRIESILRSVAMFSALDDKALADFLADCRVEHLSAGRVVFLPGQQAERFFVVLSGRVKVYQLSAAGDEQILHLLGPGQTFAEAVALSGGTYPAAAAAVNEATVLSVPRGRCGGPSTATRSSPSGCWRACRASSRSSRG